MANKKEKENKNIHEVEVKIEGKAWNDAIDNAFLKKQKTVQCKESKAQFYPKCKWILLK